MKFWKKMNKRIHGTENISKEELFNKQIQKTNDFWDKFRGNTVNLKRKRVLEVGSGVGALSTSIALSDTKEVLGIDTEKELIDFSNRYVSKFYPSVSKKLSFLNSEVDGLDNNFFDIVVSQNTFEHVYNFERFLSEVQEKMKDGAILYASFGPLFYSRYGDHRRFHRAMENYSNIKIPQHFFPWMHIIIPDSFLNKMVKYYYRKKHGKELNFDVHEGINKLKYSEYKEIIDRSGFEVVLFRTPFKKNNVSFILSKVPIVNNFFINTITIILKKKKKYSLHDLIVESSYKLLKGQKKNGSVEAGVNGPWLDCDTPVRNTSNLLKLCVFSYQKTGDTKFLIGARKCVKYLLSKTSRPYGKIFYCRKNNEDKANGLIGQAWAIEALIYAMRIIEDKNITKAVTKIFLNHEFDRDRGMWFIMNLNSSKRKLCETFNQQLWFAAMGAQISHLNPEIKKRVDIFTNLLNDNFSIYSNGLIKHTFFKKSGALSFFKKIIIKQNNFFSDSIISYGYHSFNLYGFAMLYNYYPDKKFWRKRKFKKALNLIEKDFYKRKIRKNDFCMSYNLTGIENAYALSVFKELSEKQQKCWISMQFQNNFDFDKKTLSKNTNDEKTLSFRICEATLLNDLEIMF